MALEHRLATSPISGSDVPGAPDLSAVAAWDAPPAVSLHPPSGHLLDTLGKAARESGKWPEGGKRIEKTVDTFRKHSRSRPVRPF